MTFAQPFQDYEILDRVGAGAMGTVFKARHKKLNRIVALKVLKPSLARDSRYVDRLRREARIVASLSHPHIVTGYDLGEEGGYHFFVMEFVEGKSLRALLVEWGMFAEEYVRRVARQVAEALDHAYQRGVIHRDIKPGNILIDEQGNVKLTDMGLAKGPTDMALTRDGATVGTPQYISPEQARNPQDVDVRSDLYSLGATLYHMATGAPPFRGDTMATLILKVLHDTPVPPNELNPALSDGLSLVVRKLLAKDLSVRYQTPRELLDDLDRIDRAEAPRVDAARLAGAARQSPLLRRAAIAVAAAGLLAVAVWIGAQFRERAVGPPSREDFLGALDSELRSLPSAWARLQRLRTAAVAPPSGCEFELTRREREATGELQGQVDGVVGHFLGDGWDEVRRWLRDPVVWPDRERFVRERLQPQLREAAGLALEQLPVGVRRNRVDELLAAVDRALTERDDEVRMRCMTYLATVLPQRADERLRAGDFAGAERVWNDGLLAFCDGVRTPVLDRLPRPFAAQLQAAHQQAARDALAVVVAKEQQTGRELTAEVEAVVGQLRERLAAGTEVDAVATALGRFRADLAEAWPGPGRFRAAADPWPGVERALGELQQAVKVAIAQQEDDRFARRCDLAWRVFVNGTAADGLAVLAGTTPPSAEREAQWQLHRAAIDAAGGVERAVLAALARSTAPVAAFPRLGSSQAVELRVVRNEEGTVLLCQAIGQTPRRARLWEFRFNDLVARLTQSGGDPLRDLPDGVRRIGVAVAAMVGDEFDGIGGLLRGLAMPQHTFLLDEVWPRIQRVRGEAGEAVVRDRGGLFADLKNAREEALRTGVLPPLESAILSCEARFPANDLSDAERAELRAARGVRGQLLRRRDVAAELAGAAPPGAEVRVAIRNGEVEAELEVPALALQRGAADGWQLRAGAVEFVGGDRPWSDVASQALRCKCGLSPRAGRSVLQLDLVLPQAAIGRRLYVVEFRGIAVMLVVTADDTLHAALIDGDPLREDAAQRAFQQAIQGVVAGTGTPVVAGAVHRLTIDLLPTTTRSRAQVKVAFEGSVVVEGVHRLSPDQPPDVIVYPQQELAVQRAIVRAGEL